MIAVIMAAVIKYKIEKRREERGEKEQI